MRIDAALARRDRKVDGRARKLCRSRARNRNRYSARERGWSPCLGARRRRVLKDARADKGRGDPDRVQRRDERKLKSRRGSYDKRRGRRLLEVAGTDKGDGAFMLARFRLWMQPLVPLRRDAQCERGKKRSADPARDGTAKDCRRYRPDLFSHWRVESLHFWFGARVF